MENNKVSWYKQNLASKSFTSKSESMCTSKGYYFTPKKSFFSTAHDNLCNVLSSVDQVDAAWSNGFSLIYCGQICNRSTWQVPTAHRSIHRRASMKCSKLSNLYSQMRQKSGASANEMPSWAQISNCTSLSYVAI